MIGDLAAGELLPARVYLCGGGAELPQIAEALDDDAWWRRLPFARQPQVRALRPDEVAGLRDATASLVTRQDVTPMALAHQALILDSQATAAERAMRRAVREHCSCSAWLTRPSSSTWSPTTRSPPSSAACARPMPGGSCSSPPAAPRRPPVRSRCGCWPGRGGRGSRDRPGGRRGARALAAEAGIAAFASVADANAEGAVPARAARAPARTDPRRPRRAGAGRPGPSCRGAGRRRAAAAPVMAPRGMEETQAVPFPPSAARGQLGTVAAASGAPRWAEACGVGAPAVLLALLVGAGAALGALLPAATVTIRPRAVSVGPLTYDLRPEVHAATGEPLTSTQQGTATGHRTQRTAATGVIAVDQLLRRERHRARRHDRLGRPPRPVPDHPGGDGAGQLLRLRGHRRRAHRGSRTRAGWQR